MTGDDHPTGGPADQGPHRPALVPESFGAQAERTEMAWVRTALACAGLAAAAARLLGDTTSLAALATLGVLVAVPGLTAAWWRVAGLRARPEPLPPRPAGAALLAGSVAVVDLLVLVVLVR